MKMRIVTVAGTLLLLAGCTQEVVEQEPRPLSLMSSSAVAGDDGAGIGASGAGTDAEPQQNEQQIRIPAFLFNDNTPEEMIGTAELQGAENAEVVENGDLSYTLGEQDYKAEQANLQMMMKEMTEEIVKSENFPSIKNIDVNEHMTVATIRTDQQAFESGFESSATKGIVFLASYYQAFTGKKEEQIAIEIQYVNEKTSDVFYTEVHPPKEN